MAEVRSGRQIVEELLRLADPARCFRMMLVVGRQRLAELLEQFFLRLGQPYRRFDEYRAVQVARAGGTHRAYATTAQAELLAALRAFRHVDLDLAFKCRRSEEHTSELQSLMRRSYAVF